MEALRELFLSLGLDADEASFASATAAVDLLEKGLELVAEAAKKLGEALVETVVGAVEYADKIGDLSVKTGVSTTSLQKFQYVAVQSGTSLEGISQSLTFLNRSLFEAATSGGEAGEAFARLGIKVRNADGSIADTEETFFAIAAAVAKLPTAAERAGLAVKLLGKSGAELLPLLSEDLRNLFLEAEKMGGVLKPEDLARGKIFAGIWDSMGQVFSSVRNELGLMLVEELLPILTAFKEWWLQNNALVKSKLKSFIDGVRAALRGLWNIVGAVARGFDFLVAVMKTAAVAVGAYFVASALVAAGSLTQLLVNLVLNTAAAVAYGAAMVVAGAKAAAAWIAATWPVLALTAALVIAWLVINDIQTALEGGDSVIGRLGPKWTKLVDDFANGGGVGDWLIVTQLRKVVGWLTDLEGRLLPAIKESWAASLLRPISATIELLFKLFRGTATFADYLKTIPGIGLVIDQAEDVAKKITPGASVGALYGGGGANPAATVNNSTTSKVVAPTQNNNIVVNAAPGQSPQEVAREVQEKVNQEWLDSYIGAVPPAVWGG